MMYLAFSKLDYVASDNKGLTMLVRNLLFVCLVSKFNYFNVKTNWIFNQQIDSTIANVVALLNRKYTFVFTDFKNFCKVKLYLDVLLQLVDVDDFLKYSNEPAVSTSIVVQFPIPENICWALHKPGLNSYEVPLDKVHNDSNGYIFATMHSRLLVITGFATEIAI